MAAKKKKSTGTRRRSGGRRKQKARKSKTQKVLTGLAAAIALAEVIQEQIAAGTFTALKAKQWGAAVAAFIAAGRNTVDFESLVKILGPSTALMVWNKVRAKARIRAPSIGGYSLS